MDLASVGPKYKEKRRVSPSDVQKTYFARQKRRSSWPSTGLVNSFSFIFCQDLDLRDVSTGWQPLCDFLNVKVPSSSFPKVSKTSSFFFNFQVNKTGDGFLMSEMSDVFQLAMPEFGRKKKIFYSSIFVSSIAALYLITRKMGFLWRYSNLGVSPDFSFCKFQNKDKLSKFASW